MSEFQQLNTFFPLSIIFLNFGSQSIEYIENQVMILRKLNLCILYRHIPDIKAIADVVALTNIVAIFQHGFFFHNSKKNFREIFSRTFSPRLKVV